MSAVPAKRTHHVIYDELHGPATTEQIAYIKRLLTDNKLYAGDFDRLWKLLEVHEVDVRRPGDGTLMSKEVATRTIDWLERQISRKTTKKWESR